MRSAVILFNLGGPDSPRAVKPFLKNLFADPAIVRAPFFIRPFLANYIVKRRAKPATENYNLIGGKSPLLDLTKAQASAIENMLTQQGIEAKTFIAMRYWHPFTHETVADVKAYKPDRIFLLPLYPQFSSTTTGSSLTAWREAAADAGLVADVTTLCCWYNNFGFLQATAKIVKKSLIEARSAQQKPVRLLFSAHGLPEAIVKKGDPYQFQIEQSVTGVLAALGEDNLDYQICYQSRATPQEWLKPSIDTALVQAAKDDCAVLIIPIAFVSDHSETLVELDIEYREMAKKLGIDGYFRAPTQNTEVNFISGIVDMVTGSRSSPPGLCNPTGRRQCLKKHRDCPWQKAI
jgi:ferrochelatase